MPIITCPGCKQQLGLPDENMGSIVRCPACSTTFSSQPPDLSERPLGPSLAGPPGSAIPSARPSPAQERAPDYSRYDSRWSDDDPLSISRKTAKSQWPLLLGIFGGLAAVVLLIVIVVLIVRTNRTEEAAHRMASLDLLSLVPADSLVVLGFSVPKDEDDGGWLSGQLKKNLGGDDPLANVERVVLAVNFDDNNNNLNNQPKMPMTGIVALLLKNPQEEEKIKKKFNLKTARNVNGISIYQAPIPKDVPLPLPPELQGAMRGLEVYVAMPNPRVVVFGAMSEAEFVKAMRNYGNAPQIPPDMLARIKEMETSTLWAFVHNKGIIKDSLDEQFTKLEKNQKDFLQLFKEPLDRLKQCKSASLSVKFVKKELRAEVNFECPSDQDSKRLQELLHDLWNKDLTVQVLKGGIVGALPNARPVMDDLNRTLKVEQRGLNVAISAVLSEATLKNQLPK